MREVLGNSRLSVVEECFHFWGKIEASIEDLIRGVGIVANTQKNI